MLIKGVVLMKKAIELSLNFLVTIVIAVVIFGFGIKFIYDLSSDVKEMESLTIDDLDGRIGQLACGAADKVCIGTTKKTIQKGKFDVFGIRIINILDEQDFNIEITPANPSGYTKDDVPILTNNIKLKYRNSISIKKNEEENIGIGIEVPKDTKSGTYIFDVKVLPYDEINKIYVEVP